MHNNILKRCDDPNEILAAIEEFEKAPQNRRSKRVLAKLRAKFDKLVPPDERDIELGGFPIPTRPGDNVIEAVNAARSFDEPGAAQADEP